ncbi:hypothetical protein EJ06DRAFT_560205 [Trichodelitschia bisporula]|uniref:Uncharacterized protein n=1 Tax=Trichodelitschia bisporula TaxID=703511 RepID=A0A6G1HK33_9PEZI|nr:hypothetical protein EJ06DRAFT_560205 [Trichodelitschia bisporula]
MHPHFPTFLIPTPQPPAWSRPRAPRPIHLAPPSGFGRHPDTPPLIHHGRAVTMPSPIAECADAERGLSRLSFGGEGEGMDVDYDGGGVRSAGLEGGDCWADGIVSPVTPGRKRSGAMVNGEKRKVFFGWREDCEKCRARVPGHLAHYL